ncbi:hypothetical protein H8F11_13565 [Vibrio fluvialis]|uniref:hypothetical protein n=1 Tax=Vibrio fluvialis TaxID=676 RepID=UPI00192C96B3|nr:hypothetical protein [Vibrio fluvialis]MBL4266707.1 hypothetical protein [Vibrio fluvialis]MBL4270157.1 hypothetical protein [Vibrio fluvialis]
MTQENQKSIDNTCNHSTKLERIKYTLFALTLYIYASGALFFYGFMGRLGFEGASLDSIFSPLVYSQLYIANIFSKAMLGLGLDFLVFPVKTTLLVAIVTFFTALLIKKNILSSAADKLKSKITPESLANSPIKLSLFVVPTFYVSQLFLFFLFVVLLSFIAIPLFLPYSLGAKEAKALVEKDGGKVCKEFDWSSDKYKNENIVLSCERIRVNKHGDTITGSIIHTDQKFSYVLTDNLLLRMKDGQVQSCVTKQYNSTHVKDDKNNSKDAKDAKDSTDQTKESTELKTCEELYLKAK